MFGVTEWIALALSGIMLTGTIYYKSEISDLELEVAGLKTERVILIQNNKTLKGSIDAQNRAIVALQVDLNASNYRWDNREPSVKYVDRWKTKYIDRNVTIEGGKCEKDTIILNAIREYGY